MRALAAPVARALAQALAAAVASLTDGHKGDASLAGIACVLSLVGTLPGVPMACHRVSCGATVRADAGVSDQVNLLIALVIVGHSRVSVGLCSVTPRLLAS